MNKSLNYGTTLLYYNHENKAIVLTKKKNRGMLCTSENKKISAGSTEFSDYASMMGQLVIGSWEVMNYV